MISAFLFFFGLVFWYIHIRPFFGGLADCDRREGRVVDGRWWMGGGGLELGDDGDGRGLVESTYSHTHITNKSLARLLSGGKEEDEEEEEEEELQLRRYDTFPTRPSNQSKINPVIIHPRPTLCSCSHPSPSPAASSPPSPSSPTSHAASPGPPSATSLSPYSPSTSSSSRASWPTSWAPSAPSAAAAAPSTSPRPDLSPARRVSSRRT
ncbi:hypothetical protein BZA05DRAFT_264149 [Tricharina praecox]|uniref:uncharacterized protein n=1 Tax=Tricharina praecox TaxID=43433 RepID=UPI00221FEAFC|nr:uncharacterized protein BZA05DRAFT_264149 [Tricharina praecox]KAI5854385.1 hypothetical protein BZA05DRAFT_264149 [Tricharina praecox]